MQTLIEQLQQLAPLAAAATSGHWSAGYDSEESCYRITAPIGSSEIEVYLCTELDEEDAAYIAAARNLLTPENLTLLVAALGTMESMQDTNRLLMYEKALHAAEQNMADMKNDALKLLAARKIEGSRRDA